MSNNRQLVIDATEALFTHQDVSAIERYFAEPYLQHNAHVANGLAALRGIVTHLASNAAFRYERVRVIADGDLVALHGRYVGWLPEPQVAFDVFRVDKISGKIVEHWDAMQAERAPNPSGRTMLDGPTAIANASAGDNKQVVADFLDAILVKHQMQKLGEFYAGNSLTQHNPLVADGLTGLGAFIKELQAKQVSFSYQRVHRVIGEGNFVLGVSEGEMAGAPQAFYDLFRVENGKITEHWDVIAPVPATTASGLSVF